MKIFYLFLLLFIVAFTAPQKASAQISVSFQVFYDELSPYGTWVDNSDYGYVWLPNVAHGFSPYATNGYWVFTEDGWTWVSDYPWGWAPFHYGRWFNDPYYGPMWVPDYEWGPGWVTWRRSSGYYGWAPIGPGISINLAYGDDYREHYNHYTFVGDRYLGRRNINNYYVNTTNNVTIINNSTVIINPRVDRTRNVTYNAGPDKTEVEKRVGKTFTPIAIKERSKPGHNLTNNQLEIYRPQVQKISTSGPKPAPVKVESLKNLKPPAQITVEPKQQKGNQPIKQRLSEPQKINPPTNVERVKQPQQINPPKNMERVKQPQQAPIEQVNPPKKMERAKQPQQINPPKNVERVKQPQQVPIEQVNPRKMEGVKQPQQINPPKNVERVKQSRQAKPPKKTEVEKQPQQANPPQNTGEEKPPH